MAAADFCWLIPSPRDDRSPKANQQTSPGITHSLSRLSLSDIRRSVRTSIGLCIYWPAHPTASPLSAGCSSEQRFAAASSRSHLAMDTLAVRLTLPLAGCVEDLHLLVS